MSCGIQLALSRAYVLPPIFGGNMDPIELSFHEIDILEGRICGPHCDQRVLHAPRGLITSDVLFSHDGEHWQLLTHQIDEALWFSARSRTSPESRAQSAMLPCVIPLTRRASNALRSKAMTTGSSASEPRQNRDAAAVVEHHIGIVGARLVYKAGDVCIHLPTPIEQTWHISNESALNAPASSCAPHEKTPALTVTPVFHGTSWSLTTEPENGVLMTRPLHGLYPWDRLRASEPKWLSAILSVLTAIGSELTSEQWRLERERTTSCDVCDNFPIAQKLREIWNINFTGEGNPNKQPCPAEVARPVDLIHRWPGNRPWGKYE
jgi:hypothetical protein